MINANIQKLTTPVLLLGGGIAGLWSLLRLRSLGIPAYLLETAELGGMQTLASQGIIHGGAKYALLGKMSESAAAIAGMPSRWKACLNGDDVPDLSDVNLLSASQYLWSTGSLASRVTGFFAGQLMGDRMTKLDPHAFPDVLKDNKQATVYQLNEPVLDVKSLLKSLLNEIGDYCIKADDILSINADQHVLLFSQSDKTYSVEYEKLLLTAGKGNQVLMDAAGLSQPKMQLRALKMVMLKGELPQLYAHALGATAVPRVTIGSCLSGTEQVWYLGGQLAEDGVFVDDAELIDQAKKLLMTLLPAIDFNNKQWACLSIERAEILTGAGGKPDMPSIEKQGDIWVIWPTKLAFAPLLADQIVNDISVATVASGGWAELDKACLSLTPWEKAKWN